MPLPQPEPFWEVRVHDTTMPKGISGLCVGYENKKWRYSAFADYIMEWLPEFCLNSKEREALTHSTAVQSLRKAAQLVYETEKYGTRGEFGELFLYAAIRSVFDSVPAISKMFYKDSHNNTVKGFDCVHVVGAIDDLELWIGEVKFYKDINRAINDVIDEVDKHLQDDFLRKEFALIGNKLDSDDDHTEAVQQLLSRRTSLDEIFKRICVPILLTYESGAVSDHELICSEYEEAFRQEIEKHHASFIDKSEDLPDIRYHLFLLPLREKEKLLKILDRKLRSWQTI